MANEIITDAGIITVFGDLDTVVIRGTTYTGSMYTPAYWGVALKIYNVIAAQDVILETPFAESHSVISIYQVFVGDKVIMAGNTSSVYSGGAISNAGTMTFYDSILNSNMSNSGGAICNDSYAVAKIEDSRFAANTASGFGGMIYNSGTATISNSSFNDNSAGSFGGVIYNSSGTMTVSRSSFNDNFAFDGGAIYNDSGTVTIDKCIFAGNTAEKIGGAISSSDSVKSRTWISGSTFTGNTADAGGAIGNFGQCMMRINNGVFANNMADEVGGAIFTFGTATIDNSTFHDNKSDNGGAIFTRGDVKITASSFSRNKSTYGGAIINCGTGHIGSQGFDKPGEGKIAVTKSHFSDNTADAGGAIFIHDGTATISENIFTNNRARKGYFALSDVGGAICNREGATKISGCTFTGNAAYYGGAVCNVSGVVTIENCEFIGNQAALGGAVYNAFGAVTIRDCAFVTETDKIYAETLTLAGTIKTAAEINSFNKILFDNNTTLMLDISRYTQGNSNAFLSNYNVAIDNVSWLSITVNVSSVQADGNYIIASGASKFNKSITITCGNKQSEAFSCGLTGNSIRFMGYYYSLKKDADDRVILSVKRDTAIMTMAGTATELTIGTTTYQGKACSADEIQWASTYYATIVAQDVTFTENFTIEHEFIGDRINVSGNTAAGFGGVIEAQGVVTITGSTFTGNTAAVSGGVIYSSGTATIGTSNFDRNTAVYGGAIYNSGTATLMTISGSTVSNSTASIGGAVYNDAGTVTISRNTFAGNTANKYGGAVYNYYGPATIDNSTFIDNAAGTYGGAVCNISGAVTISESVFTGNTANDGGAIYNDDTILISSSTFTGNTANYGGAIYNNGTATIENSTFSDNDTSDTYRSGAIYNVGTMTIRDSVFATSSDWIANQDGMLTFGGTIRTAASFSSTNAISVEQNTQLVLDISSAVDGSASRFSDFDRLFGESQQNLTISINVSRNQGYGTYAITSGIKELTQQNFTIMIDGDPEKSFTVSVGGTTMYDFKDYTLSLKNGNLSFSIGKYPMGIVTANGSKESIVIDGVRYTGTAYSQAQFDQALAEKGVVAAQNVTISGFTVSEEQSFLGDNVTTAGDAAEIHNAGKVTLFGTISTAGIYNTGNMTIFGTISTAEIYNAGKMTFAGAIATAENITSTNKITFENNTQLVLDISGYTAGNTTAFLSNYDTAFSNDANLSITVNVAEDQAETTYILADTASTFNKQITITRGSETSEMLSLGGSVKIKGYKYSLALDDNNNVVLSIGGVAIVTTAGTATELTFGTTTYRGTAYSVGQITTAIAEKATILTQDVTLAGFTVTKGKEFIGDKIEISGNTTTDGGGAICGNDCTMTVSGGTFSDNAAVSGGGAICGNDCTMTVSDSTFSRNTVVYNGGAIYSDRMARISGCTFTGNTARALDYSCFGGAVYNSGTAMIDASEFTGSEAARGGAIYGTTSSLLSISGSTFTGNTADFEGGAVYNSGTATISGSTFIGNITDGNGGAIYSGRDSSLLISGSTFTGNEATNHGGAVYGEGSMTIRDSVFATPTDTIYSSNQGAVTFGGTIRTAASIVSYSAITVEADTQLVLDFSARTTEMKEMLSNYDTMFGTSQSNLSITVNVAQDQAAGAYTLAVDAASCDRTITLDAENELVASLDFARKVVFYARTYRLALRDKLDYKNNVLQLIVEDVSSSNAYGGEKLSESTTVLATTGLEVIGGGTYAALIGGERITSGSITKNGVSFVTISGDIRATAVAGGVFAENCRVTVNAETSVSVENGYYSNIVCGGSIIKENTVLTVNNASRVTISGGTFANAVAGGNYIASAGGTVYGGRGSKASDAYVDISGGTFLRDIYGGNIAGKNSFVKKGNCYITGSTAITIDTSENIVSIGGNLIAGSSGQGIIIGSSNLTFKGNADNLRFGSKSIVCGDSHDATTAVSCVGGVGEASRSLRFDDFTGTLDAKIVGFDQVGLSGGSVTLSKSSRMSDVFVWGFFDGATLAFGDVDNDFHNDRLSFGTFEGDEWTVMTGDDSTLVNWDWATSVTIAGQNASFNETFGYWASADYKFYREGNALKVAKLA